MSANGDRDETGRFKAGHSGNPSGRPKKDRGLTRALEEAVDKVALAAKVVELAMAGDTALIKYIYDRIEGSPTQWHEVSYDDVIEEVRKMAKDRGLSQEDTERAVRAAEEMVRGGSIDA